MHDEIEQTGFRASLQELYRERKIKERGISVRDWVIFGIILTLVPLLYDSLVSLNLDKKISTRALVDGDLLLICTGLTGGPMARAFKERKRSELYNTLLIFNFLAAIGSVLCFAMVVGTIQQPDYNSEFVTNVSVFVFIVVITVGIITTWAME